MVCRYPFEMQGNFLRFSFSPGHRVTMVAPNCSLKIHYHPYKSRPVAILARVFYGGRHIKLKIIKTPTRLIKPLTFVDSFQLQQFFCKMRIDGLSVLPFNVAAQIFAGCLFRCCVFLKHIVKKCIFQKAFGSFAFMGFNGPQFFYHFSIHLS